MERPKTLGELKASGYRPRRVKDEMRHNLIHKIRANETLFPGILGYDETVIPEIQNAILSRHDMLLLGLRGQAKTRMLRQLIHLLDEFIPVVAGSEINDDPFHPISFEARTRIAREEDSTPIAWIPREQRYQEKLATPDVTVADILGEIDMIKHAEGRYLSSEETLHFGLIPRTNRGIFCMNELPDLSPKIQVALFNILEERDLQIRGYPVRLNLDLCMLFSANPEDYTNRGRIVTPLKDRIGSVIRTHYPLTRAAALAITDANSHGERDSAQVVVPRFMKEILEEITQLARADQAINQQSGVSVRMSLANYENMVSNAERRAVTLSESAAIPRISDLKFIAASTRGKIELTLLEDDRQEDKVIDSLMGQAVKAIFTTYFDVKSLRSVVDGFEGGRKITVGDRLSGKEYQAQLREFPVLEKEIANFLDKQREQENEGDLIPDLTASVAEFILEGLHVENKLNKASKKDGTVFQR